MECMIFSQYEKKFTQVKKSQCSWMDNIILYIYILCNTFTQWKTTIIFAITYTDKVRKLFDIVLEKQIWWNDMHNNSIACKTTHNEKRITNFGVLYCKLNSWIIWKRCQWKQFCGCNTNNQCNNLNSQKLNDYMMFVFEIYYLELCWITLWWIICIDFLTTSWQDW